MSTASTSRTIKFISKAGTYTAVIMSPSGDLYQSYTGTVAEVTGVHPNFEAMKPVLHFVCTSSRVAEGVAEPEAMEYYFNGQKLAFDAGGISTGTFAGIFKKVVPAGDQLYHGMQILKNIAAVAGYAPAVIKMVATIAYGAQTDQIQASYTIPIQQDTGTGCRVTIAAGDNNNFVVSEKNKTCILKAIATEAGGLLSKNLTYKWEKMGPTGWVEIVGQVGQTLTVSVDDVLTYGEYRVHVFRSGVEIGSDIQGVLDSSEPYEIDPHPVPVDETITEDLSGNGQVTYTPTVVSRGTNVKAFDTQFYFVLKDAAGVYLNSDRTTPKASQVVLRDHCFQAGGDVSVTITSVK